MKDHSGRNKHTGLDGAGDHTLAGVQSPKPGVGSVGVVHQKQGTRKVPVRTVQQLGGFRIRGMDSIAQRGLKRRTIRRFALRSR